MRKRILHAAWPLAVVAIVGLTRLTLLAQPEGLKQVLEDEAKRVAVVAKVRPSVVAVFDSGGKGGGSGVLISKDGYALTNFHVVKPAGMTMKCGLDDGVLYDAVCVGWDMVGDVALIKLLPKKEGESFPVAPLGDSELVKEGDWSLAMGNPFLLATDFTPTVTFGMVSGVHRYQPPEGKGFLEYTDCIQIDTSINPGNSGGPLYNMNGELIGINGRGSFDKRGRVNSGVGYAISINQIKNFMGHLKGGHNADHATLGANVTTQTEKDGLARMIFSTILEESDVAKRGVTYDDELNSFDGRPITSVNHFKNVLGLYPRGWRLPMVYRRKSDLNEVLVRLMGAVAKEVPGQEDKDKDKKPDPNAQPKQPGGGGASGPAAKYFQAKPGYVNYYFTKLEKDRVLGGFKKHGDFSKKSGDWAIEGKVRLKQLTNDTDVKISIKDALGKDPAIRMTVNQFPFKVDPLDTNSTTQELQQPGGSGGLLVALYQYHRLMSMGEKGFVQCEYAGQFPYYPPLANGKNPKTWLETKQVADVIHTTDGRFEAKWYFSPTDQKLVAFEVWPGPDTDPCEVYLTNVANGFKGIPQQMQVRTGEGTYGTINVSDIQMGEAK